VHEVYRRWRKILDEYDGDRMAVAEAHAKCIELYSERLMANEVRHMYFA